MKINGYANNIEDNIKKGLDKLHQKQLMIQLQK